MLAATLKEGLGTTITFAGHTFTLTIDPSSITPPGLDGGDAIDSTSLSNVLYRTKEPKSLIDVTDGGLTVFYDPAAWDDIVSAMNDNVLITVTFSNSDTLAFYGYIKTFEPGESVEGEAPSAEMVVVATAQTAGTETAPVYAAAS